MPLRARASRTRSPRACSRPSPSSALREGDGTPRASLTGFQGLLCIIVLANQYWCIIMHINRNASPCTEFGMKLDLTILVGTMTGTAQLVAQELELTLEDDETRVQTRLMDGLDAGVFNGGGLFLVCTSTYGQGDVQDNAK